MQTTLKEARMFYADRDTFGMGGVNGAPAGRIVAGLSSQGELMVNKTIFGIDVYNHKAEMLGKIRNIARDQHTGKVTTAILCVGGVFGLGQKRFSVPWNALTIEPEKHRFVLNVEKEHLKNSPGFKSD
jgi:sporulation protein YlmC with PRC-barrel domain